MCSTGLKNKGLLTQPSYIFASALADTVTFSLIFAAAVVVADAEALVSTIAFYWCSR